MHYFDTQINFDTNSGLQCVKVIKQAMLGCQSVPSECAVVCDVPYTSCAPSGLLVLSFSLRSNTPTDVPNLQSQPAIYCRTCMVLRSGKTSRWHEPRARCSIQSCKLCETGTYIDATRILVHLAHDPVKKLERRGRKPPFLGNLLLEHARTTFRGAPFYCETVLKEGSEELQPRNAAKGVASALCI